MFSSLIAAAASSIIWLKKTGLKKHVVLLLVCLQGRSRCAELLCCSQSVLKQTGQLSGKKWQTRRLPSLGRLPYNYTHVRARRNIRPIQFYIHFTTNTSVHNACWMTTQMVLRYNYLLNVQDSNPKIVWWGPSPSWFDGPRAGAWNQ
jgi:hypothetical protein